MAYMVLDVWKKCPWIITHSLTPMICTFPQRLLTHCSLADAWIYLKRTMMNNNFWQWILHIVCVNIGNALVPNGTKPLLYPRFNEVERGYTGSTMSVCPSVRPSVRLSVCGQNRVRTVSSTRLVGSISYLHILSSNLSRCVVCNVCIKI